MSLSYLSRAARGKPAAADRPASSESEISCTYDEGSRLGSVVDSAAGTITPQFDNLDRLISEQTPQGTVSYVYDLAGRRTKPSFGQRRDNVRDQLQVAVLNLELMGRRKENT